MDLSAISQTHDHFEVAHGHMREYQHSQELSVLECGSLGEASVPVPFQYFFLSYWWRGGEALHVQNPKDFPSKKVNRFLSCSIRPRRLWQFGPFQSSPSFSGMCRKEIFALAVSGHFRRMKIACPAPFEAFHPGNTVAQQVSGQVCQVIVCRYQWNQRRNWEQHEKTWVAGLGAR